MINEETNGIDTVYINTGSITQVKNDTLFKKIITFNETSYNEIYTDYLSRKYKLIDDLLECPLIEKPYEFIINDRDPDDIGASTVIPDSGISVNTINSASNGAELEDVSSIKYFAPRIYSSQYRAVTPRDYEAIIQSIYPKTESVAVVGGEELTPPKFGQVQISIKPKNGTYVSDFDKQQIKNKLKSYAIAGINSEIVDLKILYVECDSTIYYNTAQTNNSDDLRTRITNALTTYSNTVDINKFGGRFKYSKVLQLIDRVDTAITSNITTLKIRRDLKVLINQFAQYELCFGNRFHINPLGFNIKSTGFTISGSNDVVYLTDVPNKKEDGTLDGSGKGILSVISRNQKDELNVIAKSAGTVDYMKGEIILNTLNITGTSANNDLIEEKLHVLESNISNKSFKKYLDCLTSVYKESFLK